LEKKLTVVSEKIVGKSISGHPKNKMVDMVEYDKNALDRVLIASLLRFSQKSYQEIKNKVKSLSQSEKEKLFDKIIGERKQRHDKPLRELETTNYTFDILCDFGAYRDLQRHRMLTQTAELLNTGLGYVEPKNLAETGMVKEYHTLMKSVDNAYKKIIKDRPYEAQYIVPMAFRRRFLFHLNLREAFYLIELRSRPQGHISYRRISYQIWQEINRVHPYFAKHIKIDTTDLL
jgi:thymidylate synthase ThyX